MYPLPRSGLILGHAEADVAMNAKQKCHRCGGVMGDQTTTFTVALVERVFVVKAVPCLECASCGNVEFNQSTAKELERLTSGQQTPHAMQSAWVYWWGQEPEPMPVRNHLRESVEIRNPLTEPVTVGVIR